MCFSLMDLASREKLAPCSIGTLFFVLPSHFEVKENSAKRINMINKVLNCQKIMLDLREFLTFKIAFSVDIIQGASINKMWSRSAR